MLKVKLNIMNKTKIKYNPNINFELVELEKQHWLKKMKRNLDNPNKEVRDIIVFKVLELDKCLQIDDYYVNTHYKKYYDHNDYFIESLEKNRIDFEKNGLSLHSVDDGNFINPFMINQWYKECKDELLKRLGKSLSLEKVMV